MEWCTIIVECVFVLICILFLIILISDCDLITLIASKIGKSPHGVFNGKVIWITGASSGIGEALAKELIKSNAKLVISARRLNELERVKDFCLEINPKAEILVLPFNMTDLSSHELCFKKVIKHFGEIDVLISNAGRSQRAEWHEIQLEVDKELFELNVFSLINLNRILVKYFLSRRKGGQIVVNSSISGLLGAPYSASYTGSKHAIQGYFKGLRNEVRLKNISVTILVPGPVFSGFLNEAFTATPGMKFGKSQLKTDRRMTAERCAELSVIAMANQIEECWMGLFPTIPYAYCNAYLPYLASKLEYLACRYGLFMKLRDGRDTLRED